jgi:hypothetical protein
MRDKKAKVFDGPKKRTGDQSGPQGARRGEYACTMRSDHHPSARKRSEGDDGYCKLKITIIEIESSSMCLKSQAKRQFLL